MQWGLIPFWAKDASLGFKMINARAETVTTKPAFREALRKRRCLIPADGFYEWHKNGKVKTPFCFAMADDSIFAFAGIWDSWRNPEGKVIETCSIITTTPNALLIDIHDRMPVILPDDAYDLWLDPGFQKPDAICDLLKPFNADLMRRFEVSNRVNLVKNDDAACAESMAANISTDALRKRYRVFAMAQDSEDVYDQWTIYRCIYCEIDEGDETYLLTNGKWYRVGTDFRERVNAQFNAVPHAAIELPDYKDKSEGEYNIRVAAENADDFALMDDVHIQCGGQYDKVEFCDLFGKSKTIVHVKRYAGASAPLSHLFAQAVVSGSLFRRDPQFRADVNELLPEPFRPVIDEPQPEQYEIVLAVVSKSQRALVLPFFSRINLTNARTRLLDLGYRVSLKKIQAQA